MSDWHSLCICPSGLRSSYLWSYLSYLSKYFHVAVGLGNHQGRFKYFVHFAIPFLGDKMHECTTSAVSPRCDLLAPQPIAGNWPDGNIAYYLLIHLAKASFNFDAHPSNQMNLTDLGISGCSGDAVASIWLSLLHSPPRLTELQILHVELTPRR